MPSSRRRGPSSLTFTMAMTCLLLTTTTLLLLPTPTTAFFLLPRTHTHFQRSTSTPTSSTTPSITPLHAYYNNDTTSGSNYYTHIHTPTRPLGRITMVGAGPGDPDLLTLGAIRVLSTADLVIADRLIPQEILDLIQGELRIAGKRPGCAEKAQQEIYSWVKEGVSEGRHVVRLKIGDPFLFGRGGEEVLEYRGLGVEPKLVPGVSSAFAAPLLANIPITHRGVANQLYICTGYGREGDRPYLAPYFPNQTAVFLMAVGRLAELSQNLQNVGYPSSTPVAIVESASTPRQRTLVGMLSNIVSLAEREKAKAPAIIVVGEVVNVLIPQGGKEVWKGAGAWVGEEATKKEGEKSEQQAVLSYLQGQMTEAEAALFQREEENGELPAFFRQRQQGTEKENQRWWKKKESSSSSSSSSSNGASVTSRRGGGMNGGTKGGRWRSLLVAALGKASGIFK